MSATTVWDEKKMSGIFFGLFSLLIVSVGLQIYTHAVLNPIIVVFYLAQIAKTLTFLLLLVPIYQIGEFYPEERQSINAAIIGLVVTIILENILFYVNITGITLIVLATIYGVIMGYTFTMVHRSLTIPPDDYGNPFFILYGWLFIIGEIILIIDTFTYHSGFGIISMVVAEYIGIGVLGLIAFKFLSDAINKPLLLKKSRKPKPIESKPKPYSGAHLTKDKQVNLEDDWIIPDDYAKDDDTVFFYCTFCGVQNFSHNKYCKNCSRDLK